MRQVLKSSALLMVAATATLAQPVPPAGNALRFGNGERDDYVQIADAPALRPTEMTIELWIRPDSLPDAMHLFGKAFGTGGENSYVSWTLRGASQLRFKCSGAGTSNIIANPLEVGRWMHVACVSTVNKRELWIDGALRVATSGGEQNNYDAMPFIIGSDFNYGVLNEHFSGAIDDVRLWDHPRSGEQIRTFMSQTLDGTEVGLLGYWPFDEGEGQTANDASPNGNDGTLGANGAAAGDTGDPQWVPVCYADGDWSTGPGVLDIFDFLYFQDRFIASDPFACNCEVVSGPNVCDIFDFLCFQNRFVAGCE